MKFLKIDPLFTSVTTWKHPLRSSPTSPFLSPVLCTLVFSPLLCVLLSLGEGIPVTSHQSTASAVRYPQAESNAEQVLERHTHSHTHAHTHSHAEAVQMVGAVCGRDA